MVWRAYVAFAAKKTRRFSLAFIPCRIGIASVCQGTFPLQVEPHELLLQFPGLGPLLLPAKLIEPHRGARPVKGVVAVDSLASPDRRGDQHPFVADEMVHG